MPNRAEFQHVRKVVGHPEEDSALKELSKHVRALVQFDPCGKLWGIRIGGPFGDEHVDLLLPFRKLIRVDLVYCFDPPNKLSVEGFEQLLKLTQLRALTVLDYAPQFPAARLLPNYPALQWLAFPRCGLRPHDVDEICRNRSLFKLVLENNDLTDAVMPSLLQLLHPRVLNVARTGIPESAIDELQTRFPRCRIVR